MPDATLRYPHLLFDLDGTLTDPREGITRSVQFALARLGIDEPDLARLEHFIGPPLLECFMQTYGLDETLAWQAVNHYRERFEATGLYENRVFDGIPELLETLAGRGHKLYIATSKPGVFAREIARHFALDRHIEAIHGSELDGSRARKDELIRHLLASEGLVAAHCLMIGDRMHDLLGASRNGIACIGVGYGFGSEEELRAHQPLHYCADLDALRRVLESC